MHRDMPSIVFSDDDIRDTLKGLNVRTHAGPFAISASALRCLLFSGAVNEHLQHQHAVVQGNVETDDDMKTRQAELMASQQVATFLNRFVAHRQDRNSFLIRNVFLSSIGVPLCEVEKRKTRPIGIPCTWQKMVSLTLARKNKMRFLEALGPQQMGLQPNAIDKVTHLIRARIQKDLERTDGRPTDTCDRMRYSMTSCFCPWI